MPFPYSATTSDVYLRYLDRFHYHWRFLPEESDVESGDETNDEVSND